MAQRLPVFVVPSVCMVLYFQHSVAVSLICSSFTALSDTRMFIVDLQVLDVTSDRLIISMHADLFPSVTGYIRCLSAVGF